MSSIEIISLVVTLVCVISFSVVFTILFRNYYHTEIENVKTGREDADLIERAVYQEKENINKPKKTAKTILKVTEYVIIGLIAAFFIFSMYSRFSGNVLMFGKRSFMVIATDSMSLKNSNNKYLEEYELNNQFNAHDIIGIAPYESEEDVNLYDVVAYKSRDGVIIVHRIREIETLDDGTKAYHTRGDKNAIDDDNNFYGSYLTFDDIVGYYTGTRVPDIGIFVIFVQSNAGIITIVSIIYCLMMYDRLSNKYEKAMEERTELLFSVLNFDPGLDEKTDVVAQYRETIFFKGTCYVFEDGKPVASFQTDGLDVNKALAEESAGADISHKLDVVSDPKQEVLSSSPDEILKKEESLSEPFSPADSEKDNHSELNSETAEAHAGKRVKEKRTRKKPKVAKKDYDSFLDHIDDTENIL